MPIDAQKIRKNWTPKNSLGLAASFFLLMGIVLKFTVGEHFIFSFEGPYSYFGWRAFFVLWPVLALVLYGRLKRYLRLQYRSWEVRLIMFVVTTCMLAAIPVFAPLGWIALCARLFEVPSSPMKGQLGVEQYNPSRSNRSRGCDQHAELVMQNRAHRICLQSFAKLPMDGGPVIIKGKVSVFGFRIESIVAQP
jgi:hypothetical protein